MDTAEFRRRAGAIAARRGWTLDVVETDGEITAWFSEPHPRDEPGRPYGADTAQAYARPGEPPVGLTELET
jgi:hypothetical protein